MSELSDERFKQFVRELHAANTKHLAELRRIDRNSNLLMAAIIGALVLFLLVQLGRAYLAYRARGCL